MQQNYKHVDYTKYELIQNKDRTRTNKNMSKTGCFIWENIKEKKRNIKKINFNLYT